MSELGSEIHRHTSCLVAVAAIRSALPRQGGNAGGTHIAVLLASHCRYLALCRQSDNAAASRRTLPTRMFKKRTRRNEERTWQAQEGSGADSPNRAFRRRCRGGLRLESAICVRYDFRPYVVSCQSAVAATSRRAAAYNALRGRPSPFPTRTVSSSQTRRQISRSGITCAVGVKGSCILLGRGAVSLTNKLLYLYVECLPFSAQPLFAILRFADFGAL